MNQVNLHRKIRQFVETGVQSADFEYLKNDLLVNPDAVAYFYSQIDGDWVNALYVAGFFDALSHSSDSEDYKTNGIYAIDYLVKVVDPAATAVADVILRTPINTNALNAEVVAQFVWIASRMPAAELARVVVKMRDEQWVQRLSLIRQKSGYEFASMTETLQTSVDYKSLLVLAQAILIPMQSRQDKLYSGDIFCVRDVSQSGIFGTLSQVQDTELVDTIALWLIGHLEYISTTLGVKPDRKGYFEYYSPINIHDQNLFTLSVNSEDRYEYKIDEKNYIALLCGLLRRVSGDAITEVWEALQSLPSSELSRKLQSLFLVEHASRYPVELYNYCNQLFDAGDQYYELFGGAEYKYAIRQIFGSWSLENQIAYLDKLASHFQDQIVKFPDQPWHKRNALELLSVLSQSMETDESEIKDNILELAREFDGEIDKEYIPAPRVQTSRGGMVRPRAPIDNLADYNVSQVFELLKTNWTPAKLAEEYKNDDFLTPRGADGLGELLRDDLKTRIGEYFTHLLGERDYQSIHPHYIYSILRGFEELLRDESRSIDMAEVGNMLLVLFVLQKADEKYHFPTEKSDTWIANWIWVKNTMGDVLLRIVEHRGGKDVRAQIHNSHKDQMLGLINYLFDTPESPDSDSDKSTSNDPFHDAINSVRGRAYQAFIVYMENDGTKLSEDSREFFVLALKDVSTPVHFLIGHYLASVYYRDEEFTRNLFGQIFPDDESDSLATWEGYLSSSLYKEMYIDLQDYYTRAISRAATSYPDRKYTKDLDEGLTIHIALAFAHFGENHTEGLVLQMLKNGNVKQVAEFVLFIGRNYFTRDSASLVQINELGGLERFLDLWNWLIGQKFDPTVYSGFGFWINTTIFSPQDLVEMLHKTFAVSNGALGWEYKFEESLVKFAEVEPQKTLDIIRMYLLDNSGNSINPNRRYPLFSIDKEIKSALTLIYNSREDLKPEVAQLIDDLIRLGSRIFWSLEHILSAEK